MALSRRTFIQAGLWSSAARLAAQEHHHSGAPPLIRPALRTGNLEPFVDRLPIPRTLLRNGVRTAPGMHKVQVPYYKLAAQECRVKVHRDMQPTRFWSFGGSFPGPTIEVYKRQPVLIEWENRLPENHFLPIDHNLHGAEAGLPEARAVVHVHGARVPPESDGYPENWYVPGKSATSFYPNEQDAAMLWYHDHTVGINRLNIFAGMFGAFLVRDEVEAGLNLPSGEYEIPLILCDRSFDQECQLNYPVSTKPGAPWVPEFAGEAMLVNGKLMPFAEVRAASYRLRILNACNSRFLNLAFSENVEFTQIGSDQGLLAKPVRRSLLSIAPGERVDVIVNFAALRGTRITLKNDVLSVLQFRVREATSASHFVLPGSLVRMPRMREAEAIKTRVLSLDEVVNDFGEVTASLLNNQRWHDPVTERPRLNTTEIWSFVNTTDDTHPIHLHLVRFQILDRRPFDLYNYQLNGALDFTGPAMAPEPGEEGWKDTVRAFAQMVTRIIVRFEGYAGRYVWHCHILEHEDNDMMRPYEVLV